MAFMDRVFHALRVRSKIQRGDLIESGGERSAYYSAV